MTTNRSARAGRICLIIPPSVFLMDERVFPSLGILRVAASLESAGVGVDMLDLSGIHNYTEAVSDYAGASDVPFFGITTTTAQLPAAGEISKTIRSVRPDARIILGGPHVTLTAAAVKLEEKRGRRDRAHRALAEILDLADVLVSGDGEAAIFRCFDAEAGTLIDADDPQGGLFMSDGDYNESPWPARHLIDLETYRYSIEGHSSTSLISQLGCPFGCGFCGGRTSRRPPSGW